MSTRPGRESPLPCCGDRCAARSSERSSSSQHLHPPYTCPNRWSQREWGDRKGGVTGRCSLQKQSPLLQRGLLQSHQPLLRPGRKPGQAMTAKSGDLRPTRGGEHAGNGCTMPVLYLFHSKGGSNGTSWNPWTVGDGCPQAGRREGMAATGDSARQSHSRHGQPGSGCGNAGEAADRRHPSHSNSQPFLCRRVGTRFLSRQPCGEAAALELPGYRDSGWACCCTSCWTC